MKTRISLIAAALLSLALPVGADHCEAWWTHDPIAYLDLRDEGGNEYYVWKECFDWCDPIGETKYSISEESNGLPRLQIEGEWESTTCHGMIDPDRVVL